MRSRPSPTPPTEPRFSFEAWQKYEPIIAAWLSYHPAGYCFRPQGLSIETCIPRLRDAVKSALNNNFPSNLLDLKRLREVWPTVVVTRDAVLNDVVRIGPPLKISSPPLGHTATSPSPDQKLIETEEPTLHLDDLPFSMLSAMHLVNMGIFKGNVIAPNSVRDVFDTALNTHPNLSILSESDTHFTFF